MRAAVVVIILAATACGSFGAASEPAPDGGALDGGALDAGELDASNTSDASDASLDAAAEGCGWPLLSDVFERDQVVGPPWAALEPVYPAVDRGLTLSTAPSPFPSMRDKSLQVEIIPAGQSRAETLSITLGTRPGPAPSCIELELAIYVEAFAGGVDANFASIELDDSTGISLWNDISDSLFLAEQTVNGSAFERAATVGASKGEWHRIRVRYTYAPMPVLSFRFDDAVVPITMHNIAKGKPDEVRVGAGFTRAATTAKFWLDDVVIH